MADIDWNLIKQEYIKSNGAVLLKELAAKYGVKDSTVRSRKNREKWDNELNGVATQQCNVAKENKSTKNVKSKRVRSENHNPKNDFTKRNKAVGRNQEVEEIMYSELTDKQELFCIYYTRCFNATKAYQKAYDCSYDVANANGPRLLVNASIEEEIDRLKASKLKGAMLEPEDLLQKYIDIAFADITDYIEFGQEEVPVMTMYGPLKDEDDEIVTKMINVIKFNNSKEVDGTIISEVKQGKDGVSIKLQDKMKALDFLAKYSGLLDVPTKQRLDNERRKMYLLEKQANDLDSDIIYYDIEDGDEDE